MRRVLALFLPPAPSDETRSRSRCCCVAVLLISGADRRHMNAQDYSDQIVGVII